MHEDYSQSYPTIAPSSKNKPEFTILYVEDDAKIAEEIIFFLNLHDLCKFHPHVSTHFTLKFPPISQTCFHPFHFYVSTF